MKKKLLKMNVKKVNLKPLREIPRENFKLIEKQLAKKMMNPFYFSDRALQVGLNITLDTQHINHGSFKLTNQPNCKEIGIEIKFVNKIL